MRLECPECRARYEVADSAIPAAGRTVQCGACGHTWFQAPIAAAPEPEPPARPALLDEWDAEFEDLPRETAEPEASPAFRTLYRRKPDALMTDPEEGTEDLAATVVRPLAEPPRPEASRPEASRPAVPAPASPRTVISAPVAPRPPVPAPEAPRRAVPTPAEARPEPEDVTKVAPLRQVPAPEPEAPDGQAALASLLTRNRAARDQRLAPAPGPAPETGPSLVPGLASEAEVPAPGRSRFATGLTLALLLFLILLAAYALRAPLAEAVPAAAPWLDAYAAQVDAGRLALGDLWTRLLGALGG